MNGLVKGGLALGGLVLGLGALKRALNPRPRYLLEKPLRRVREEGSRVVVVSGLHGGDRPSSWSKTATTSGARHSPRQLLHLWPLVRIVSTT